MALSRLPYCTRYTYRTYFNNMDCHALLQMGTSALLRLAQP
jgi:hypothetical protein